jgi:hypothetical protein
LYGVPGKVERRLRRESFAVAVLARIGLKLSGRGFQTISAPTKLQLLGDSIGLGDEVEEPTAFLQQHRELRRRLRAPTDRGNATEAQPWDETKLPVRRPAVESR